MKHGLGTLKLTEEDVQSAVEVIDSNWLSPGPRVKEFERAFSGLHNQKHGVMVNSGTDALRIVLAALKEKYRWNDGDVVLVPSVTFVATVNVVLQLNLKPMLVDVGMYDFNLNPDNLDRRLSTMPGHSNVKAVMPVHLGGRPCDMARIMDIAKKYDLKVLEDSCETMGVGGICRGDVTAFSFYVAHLLTTGVGGMATTNDPDLARLMWSYANHGRKEPGKFEFERIGYSCRPTEFEAAIGLNQLPKLHDIVEKRRKNAFYLYKHLQAFSDLCVSYFPDSACMFFPVVLKQTSDVKKQDLMDHLANHGIESRDLMPLTNQPCYKGLWGPEPYSVAHWVNEKGFYIGCHQDMTRSDLDDVVEAFRAFNLTKESI